MHRFLSIITLVVLSGSCKKDSIEKNASISGTVINSCTGQGFQGAVLTLGISNNGGNTHPASGSSVNTTSDANGNFSFPGLSIHSSNDYSYSLIICAASNPGSWISTKAIAIDKNKHSNIQMNVVPWFNSCTFYVPANMEVSPTDTCTILLEQRFLKKNNFSQKTYQSGPFNFLPYRKYSFSGAMGWWYITLDKVKNGVHSVVNDSIYLGVNATVTDTLHF